MGKSRWGAGAIVITIAALSVAGCSSNSPDRGSEESIAQCETRIERLLKAPATADFNSTASTNGTEWTVKGDVDSQNSFGANVRSTYQCTVVINKSAATATTTVDYLE